jgi:hypothetical protein
LVADLGEAGAGNQPYIPCSNDGQLHKQARGSFNSTLHRHRRAPTKLCS